MRLKNASEEMHLKKQVWRRAPEDTSSEAMVIRQKINGKESKLQARQVDVTAKFLTSLKSSINRDEDLENNSKKIQAKCQYSVQNVVNKTSTT